MFPRIKEKEVVIDLSNMLRYTGTLIADDNVELKLIEFYTTNKSFGSDTISVFTNWLLKYLFKDNIDRPYNDISTFYRERLYTSKVTSLFFKLEHTILNQVRPNIQDIHFMRYEKKTSDKLYGRFLITEIIN